MTLVRFLIMLVVFLALNVYLFIRGWQAIPDRKAIHINLFGHFCFFFPVYFCGHFCRPVPACMDGFCV